MAGERSAEVGGGGFGWSGENSSVLITTYALIAANVLVFVAMVVSGVSFLAPTPLDAVNRGADFGPLTSGANQWWRLFTACFVHFGIVHLGMNMFVLYQIGPFAERMFGRVRYVLLYVLSGLGGSLVSLWIHPLSVGAGASGAIFGLYGAVFGFLLIERKTLGPEATKAIGRYAGMFVLYNVMFGAINRRTDMSAHIGGLAAGFLLGLLLVRPAGSWRVPEASA